MLPKWEEFVHNYNLRSGVSCIERLYCRTKHVSLALISTSSGLYCFFTWYSFSIYILLVLVFGLCGQTSSLICRILHILRKPNSVIANYTMLYKYSKTTFDFLGPFNFYFSLRLLNMRWLQPTRRFVSCWLCIISYPMYASGIMVKCTARKYKSLGYT